MNPRHVLRGAWHIAGPLLPRSIADRIRPLVYAVGIVLVLAGLASSGVLPVEVSSDWRGYAVTLGIIALCTIGGRLLDSRPTEVRPAEVRFPPAFTEETVRLVAAEDWSIEEADAVWLSQVCRARGDGEMFR